jgi:protein-S-isoprenylcysteine O-methyltransferase Ste14
VYASPAARRPGARIFAWTGAALFAASLVYFLLSYAITYGAPQFGRPSLLPVVVDVVLFSAFALHHSVFARQRVRAWVHRHVPAALERSFYVWVASLLFIGVCALWQPVAGIAWHVEGGAELALRIVQFLGVSLTLRSAVVLDMWELAGIRQLAASTPKSEAPNPNGSLASERSRADWELGVGRWEFKAEGPYGWVRHPIYLGWLLIVFPVPTMTMTRLVFAVVSSVYLLVAIPLEERSLRATTAGAYDDYIRKVRWKLVPGLY